MKFNFKRVAQIKSTAYYRTALQIHSGSAQIGKGVWKFQKFYKNLSSNVPFSLKLQPCSPEFLTLANTYYEKNVFFAEKAGRLPEKGLKWNHLINWTLLKKYLHTFLRGCQENCYYGSFGKLPKKMSSVAFLLKNSGCPIHRPITFLKTDFTKSISCFCSENFQNCWESVCLWWNHFLEK